MLESSMLNYTEKVYTCDLCGGTVSYSDNKKSHEDAIAEELAKIMDKDKTAKQYYELLDHDLDGIYIRAYKFLRSININVNPCPRCDGAGEIYSIRG